MFISIILNTEYMDVSSRKMWYLKNLLHCKENGRILITHDYMRKHFEELQASVLPHLFEQFEMRRMTSEEAQDIEQYFIPDELFDELERRAGSRTALLKSLDEECCEELDSCLDDIFTQIERRHPGEKIEGIFHCLEGFESIRKKAREYACPLINYSFAAFRKPHGYRQTLYQANRIFRYLGTEEFKLRYESFLASDHSSLPVFDNRELIIIFGKERTLPLIKLIDYEPQFELGVCCECFSVAPQGFYRFPYSDDDIFYEGRRRFPKNKIKVRSHSLHLDDIQVDRSEVRNDPAAMILSCRRLAAVQSQILLKALLWNRCAVMRTDTLPLACLCEADLDSTKRVDVLALNYYIFGYLVPSGLMFSDEYWRWRLSDPSEVEIYSRHLNYVFSELRIPNNISHLTDADVRFRRLLESRGCDSQLIFQLLDPQWHPAVNWDVAYARFDVIDSFGQKKSFWRLNELMPDGSLKAILRLPDSDVVRVSVSVLDDMAGFARLISLNVNGRQMAGSERTVRYFEKGADGFTGDFRKCGDKPESVECVWEYKPIKDYLACI